MPEYQAQTLLPEITINCEQHEKGDDWLENHDLFQFSGASREIIDVMETATIMWKYYIPCGECANMEYGFRIKIGKSVAC
jgi:hypothetical protein